MARQKLNIYSSNTDYDIGDYITGKDRNLTQAIYRVLSFHSGIHKGKETPHILLEFLSNKQDKNRRHTEMFPLTMATKFRTATREELLKEGVLSKSIDFIIG